MEYTKETIHKIVENQKIFFRKGNTLSIKNRIQTLKTLKNAILANQDILCDALYKDLGRSPTEAFLCDIGPIIMEINEIIHHLKRWARPETHFSGIISFPSIFTKVYKIPFGVSLIISPFNFPYLLSLGVLSYSIAGGNTAIIKASSKSKYCTEAMQKIIADTFKPELITVIDGGHDVADYCLEEKVDKIFYTGSPNVGKHVMELASKNLVPVTLELGGETGNWCILRKDADIKDAARKIAFFKLLNAGQVCININQVAVPEEIADEFVDALKNEFIRQIDEKPLENDEYPHLIGSKAYQYIKDEAEQYRSRIVFGGHGDDSTNKYEPTIIYPVSIDEPIVNHEIFGPLLPIVKYKDDEINDLLETVSAREHGLALYLFTKNIRWAKKIMSTQQYGGGCINEVCIHLMVKGVPFNGVGHSGMGSYHGEWGFREFTHPSTCLIGKNHLNLKLREHPYTPKKNKIFKKLMK